MSLNDSVRSLEALFPASFINVYVHRDFALSWETFTDYLTNRPEFEYCFYEGPELLLRLLGQTLMENGDVVLSGWWNPSEKVFVAYLKSKDNMDIIYNSCTDLQPRVCSCVDSKVETE
mgnify:CR=1 FL=1